MNLTEYQAFTQSLAVYNTDVTVVADYEGQTSRILMPYMYPVLALTEEAGEVAGKVAKFVRKSNQGVTPEQLAQLKDDVAKELGDVMYSVSELARHFGFSLDEIIERNVAKLSDRKDRGVLVGEGDNR